MAEMPELFAVGELVRWRDPDDLHHRMFKSPSGPFRVRKVELVPEGKCTCGGYLDDRMHQTYDGCPYRGMTTDNGQNKGYGREVRESVGHWQWVEVEDPTTSEFIPSPIDGDTPSLFSGAWFTRAAA